MQYAVYIYKQGIVITKVSASEAFLWSEINKIMVMDRKTGL